MADLVTDLTALLGDGRVDTDPETLAAKSHDTWPLRLVQMAVGATPAPPRCVVRPRNAAEVATALAYLDQQGIPVVPRGGGSGVGGGAQPGPEAVVVDVSALDQILALDETNLMVTVQAGVCLGRLEAWLNARGYISGHSPQSIATAQMGGLVATRSAGQFSTKYGNMEDLLVGLEAVLPDGRAVRVNNVPRRSAGPDLRQLWLGSEGAFGIITEVTVKIFPRPQDRWLQAYGVPSMRTGLELIARFMRAGWRPAVVRLQDETEAQRAYAGVASERESIVLLLSEGPEGYASAEGAALDRIMQSGGARPLGPGPVQTWLAARNDVHEFTQYISKGIIVDTIEVAAGWSAIADIYEETIARLRAEVPELALVFGHSSHAYAQGANLYFILGAVPPRNPAAVEQVYYALWQRVMAITLAHGGTICHHHGIGKLRVPWVPAELGSAYPLLAGLKRLLDPRGLMNPGTLLPDPAAGERP